MLHHDENGGVRFNNVHEFEDVGTPDSAKLAEGILGERDRPFVERVHKVMFKDQDRAAIILDAGKVSSYWRCKV